MSESSNFADAMRHIWFFIIIMALAGCAKTDDEKAKPLLAKINTLYAGGKYREALDSIVVLRDRYPKAVVARTEALRIWQDASLKMAQADVAATDNRLQEVEQELRTTTDRYRCNMLGVKRDSLQARYEAMCGVVRMTRMRQQQRQPLPHHQHRAAPSPHAPCGGARRRHGHEELNNDDSSCSYHRFFVFLCRLMDTTKTEQQFKSAMQECRALFEKKLHDYKASWRILRPSSLTDQLFIKAKRIRSLEIKKESLVGEGIRPEFVALINYGIVGLIQLDKGFADSVDITNDEAMTLYDKYAGEALQLMTRKNHDYDEAWRTMRVSSYTDFILTKIERVKEIENLGGNTLVSEGIASNYMDIINYAVFGVIKLSERES